MSSGLPLATRLRDLGPKRPFDPIIVLLQTLVEKIQPGSLDKAVKKAVDELGPYLTDLGIKDGDGFLNFANELLVWAPFENNTGKEIYDVLCVFYFVLDQDPLGGYQNPIQPDQANKPLEWLSAWIVCYAQLVGQFMDTPASMNAQTLATFETPNSPYDVGEAVVPPGGFQTFNQFFTRHLKPGARPIADPDDNNTIVYPADCTYQEGEAFDITSGQIVVTKIPWLISDLLKDSKFADDFQGGVFMHAFLNTFNYHRQHAPVSGTVVEARVIHGAAYLDVQVKKDDNGNKILKPHRHLTGNPAPDAKDGTGYQFLQTRGLIIIDTPNMGLVAVLPIGMAHVSSVNIEPTVILGQPIQKGDPISWFQFGGSDIIVVFQSQSGLTKDSFVLSPDNHWSKMGSKLAEAKPTIQ